MPWSTSVSPNSQSYGAIQNQSYNGMGPGYWNYAYPNSNVYLNGASPMDDFNARNYKPKQAPVQQPVSTAPQGGQQAPAAPAAQSPLTQALANFGGTPQVGQLGTYQSGIASGKLPQATVDKTLGYLDFNTGQTPTGQGVAPAGNGTQWNDLMRQGALSQRNDMERDAAYAQSQLGFAHDKARANAGVAGSKYLLGLESDRIQQELAKRSLMAQAMGLIDI